MKKNIFLSTVLFTLLIPNNSYSGQTNNNNPKIAQTRTEQKKQPKKKAISTSAIVIRKIQPIAINFSIKLITNYIQGKVQLYRKNNQIISNSLKKFTTIAPTNISLDMGNIIGCKEAKKAFEVMALSIEEPKRFEQTKTTAPKGVILHGDPGSGKRSLVEAFAKKINRSIYRISGLKLSNTILTAEKNNIPTPSVLPKKQVIHINSMDSIKEKALVEITNLMKNKKDQNFFIGTINQKINDFNPWIKKFGHFNTIIHIKKPNKKDRKKIINQRIQPMSTNENNKQSFSEKTNGFSVTELADLVNKAKINALLRQDEKTITENDFEKALFQIKKNKKEEFLNSVVS